MDDPDEYSTLLRTLVLQGFVQNIDFYDASDFQRIFISIYFLCAFEKCYIEQVGHVTNWTCTLKCKKCSASIPYLKEKNPSTEQMKQEIDFIFSKVDYIHTYDLTGGETFLVSDSLAETIPYLFERYGGRFGEILVVTNATVIPKERMMKALAKYKKNIRIIVSCYDTVDGWQEKFERFKAAMDDREIPYEVIRLPEWVDFGFGEAKLAMSEKGHETYFDRCWTNCRLYKDGILYYCVHGHGANMAFYPESSEAEECLDIRAEDVDRDVIVEYNLGYSKKGYLEVCRHCYGQRHRNRHCIPVAEQI